LFSNSFVLAWGLVLKSWASSAGNLRKAFLRAWISTLDISRTQSPYKVHTGRPESWIQELIRNQYKNTQLVLQCISSWVVWQLLVFWYFLSLHIFPAVPTKYLAKIVHIHLPKIVRLFRIELSWVENFSFLTRLSQIICTS